MMIHHGSFIHGFHKNTAHQEVNPISVMKFSLPS